MKAVIKLVLVVLIMSITFTSKATNKATSKAQVIPTLSLYAENLAPNNYIDKQGQVAGHATETIKAIMAKAQLNYNIDIYPWARAYKLARTNAYSGVFSIMRSTQREAHFRWVCPIAKQESLYFIRLASREDIVLNNINDAKNYITSVSRDEFDHQLLLQYQFEQRKHFKLTTGDDTNLRLLLNGYTDLIIAAPSTIKQSALLGMADAPQVAMILSLQTEKSNPLCLAFGLKTPQTIVDKLQQALNELKNLRSRELKTKSNQGSEP